jgi:3-dehydroquinate dehydratase
LHSSINDLINKEDYSLTYVKLDDAIKIVKSLGIKASLSKCDVSDAFKNISLNPET